MSKVLLLVIGGSLGTLCRYFLAEWALVRWGVLWPYGTFAVNMLGCMLIGALVAFLEIRFTALAEVPVQLRLLLLTGFLGAMTTFSSYELEAFILMRQGTWERALFYLAGSVVLGIVALAAGYKSVRLLAQFLAVR